jgi:membrane fusion protein, heavy metal efflux system
MRISTTPTLLPFALLAVSSVGCRQSQAAAAVTPPPGEVWVTPQQSDEAHLTTVSAEDREVGNVIVTSGKVAFDDLRVSHVFSPVTGRVTRIDAELGARVKKGQSLATIDSPDLGLASADLAKADADLAAAEHDYSRQKDLEKIGAVARKDYETAEDSVRKARAELERARQKARLLSAGGAGGAVGQGFVLRSLIDGEVVNRTVNPGMEVQGQYSGGGAVELFTIGDLDHVWVIADAFEMDLSRIKPGEKVSIKVVAYPDDKPFEGTVDWVSGTLDPTTRTAKVRCVIPNPDHKLKPEMFATVAITAPGTRKLAIPRNAVLHLGDQSVVYIALGAGPDGKMRFERRPVSVDEDESGDLVPVLRGIQQGESVVASGAILLNGV